jgi:predicted Zn-dependent protease
VTIAASEEQARSQDSLLPAIHRLSNSILRSLAGQEVDSKDQRLEKVTTTSLEALSLFSRAESTMRSGGGPRAQAEAEQLLRRAVDLDPQFASAWNLLAWTIWNQGRSQSEYLLISDKAIEYAGTATDHEAQFIRATSYRFHEETDRAIAAFEAVAEAYPDDYWSANNAWITCMDRGHEREAGTMARQVADLRPNDPLSLYEAWKSNDAEPDISNRYLDRLVAMLQEGVELPRYVAASTIWARDVLTPANKGELATAMNAAAKLATELQDQPQPAGFALSLGKTHQADDLASPQFWSMHLIIAEQRGDREALRKLVHDSGKRELHNSLVPGLLARAGYVDDARRLAQRYAAFLAEYTIGQAFTQGEIALAEGKTHAAILLLREAYEHFSAARQPPVFLAAEDLARALDRIHQTHEAIRVLEPLEKDHRFNFESSFAPGTDQLLLAQLYRKVGRINEAKRIEGELLALWKNADPDFQPLIQLKRQTGIQKIQ